MRFALLSVVIVVIAYSREQECHDFSNSSESCDTSSLTICDSSLDLRQFFVRRDESYDVGTTSGIKSVHTKGEIAWVGNNGAIGFEDGEFYLAITNYADTSWLGLENWAYQRENVLVKFNPFSTDIQKIHTKQLFIQDSTLSFALYHMYDDDQIDAEWDIDPNQESWIVVKSMDTVDNIIEGEFDLSFVLSQQSTISGIKYAPYARFKCGKFRAGVKM